MTDQQFAAWLKSDSALRCLLVEVDVKTVGGSIVTRYLSNRGYVTSPSDTPANTSYASRIVGGIKFTQSLSIDGNVSLSFGDIELTNVDGGLDGWLDDFWSNRNIKVFVGDMSWPRADFRQVLAGVTTGIDTRKRDRINIKLSDKLQRLNTPVTEAKLGGSGPNADNLIPLCFGECHNVSPVLVDSTVNEYQVHNGPIEDIIEVRDNGVPIAADKMTKFLTLGKFRLTNTPVGVVTVSVQGDKNAGSYVNDVGGIVQRIVTGFGSASLRFVAGDIDSAAMTAYRASNVAPVGVYLRDRANVLDVCNQLTSSLGSRIIVSPEGLMSLVKLHLPASSSGTTVTATDMKDRTLQISQMVDVVASVKLGYCKNWTVQDNLQTGIPSNHADLYGDEWLTVTRTDSAAAANYNLYTDPTMVETLLLTSADAITEANRRLAIFATQRRLMKYTGFYHLIQERVGSPQTIQHSRFGLASGKTGIIASVSMDWMSPQVEIEVLI